MQPIDLQQYKWLDAWRQKADPLGDQTISKLAEDLDPTDFQEIFLDLIHGRDQKFKANTHPTITAFLEASSRLPAWAEAERLRAASRFFGIYGPQAGLILLIKSLPTCYAMARGVEVLYRTGRMNRTHEGDLHVLNRRVIETSQFIVDVLQPGGFENGQSIFAIQKTRLIHAFIRNRLLAAGWNTEKYGLPINQEDLLGTLFAFGILVLKGLEQIGIDLKEEEKADYLHCWYVIGHVIGIDPALIPDDKGAERAEQLAQAILRRNIGPSEGGKAINDALISLVDYLLPGNAMDQIAHVMMHFLLGPEICTVLGMPRHEGPMGRLIPHASRLLLGIGDDMMDMNLLGRMVFSRVNRMLLQALIHYYRKEKRIFFHLPAGFRKQWELPEQWFDQMV